jgi:dipeptidyl aminopeptidase/acylaminoacyl peptidase
VKRLLPLALLLACALPAAAAAPRILPYQDAWPVWSPNGKQVAFTRVHTPRNLMELEVLDLGTDRVTKLAQNSFQLAPSWSPDGRRIAYQSGGDVYVTDLRGVKQRIGKGFAPAYGDVIARVVAGNLVVGGKIWARNVIGRPAWSPDRRRIAFQRDGGIYISDGNTETRYAAVSEPGQPSWSPDGSRLAFTSRNRVYVATRVVAANKPNASVPSWAADGRAVVYTWQGGMTETTTAGVSKLLRGSAGLGAAYAPHTTVLAYAGPRPACPGHESIRILVPLTGSCEVRGTPRADVIEGSPSFGDVILAGAGNDLVHANDRRPDRVDCGSGRDEVWADRSDRLARCEIVHR